ncbi:hypothetical protein HPB48_017228 [Haemaphysalis longicornis]|uniref:MATH domain-containing protein n=1 Tax=Haemaphysalis longicornis TaxID=44386 RepID=A0A9J6GJL1_HAELO|nr:hypothetical protein HPB48_017228 [Haemaphysalis longicornis]
MRIASALSNLDEKVSLLQRSLEENLKSIVSGSGQVVAQKATAESSILESIQCLENTLIESTRFYRGAVDQMSDAQAALQNDIGAVMSSLQGIKDEFGMLNASLNQTIEEKSSNIKESIDKLETAGAGEREEMREKLDAIEKMMQDHLESEAANSKCSEECPDDEAGKTSAPESVADLHLEERLNVSEAFEWTIQPWSEAKLKSNRKRLEFIYPPKPGYFYGYHINPYAVLKRSGKSQLFHLGFQIITGECDNLLAWPMKKTLRLTLLHPTECGRAQSIVACTACENPDSDPSLGLQTLPQLSAVNIDAMKLEESGFIKDDKLSLRFEVLQCSTPNSHAGPQF